MAKIETRLDNSPGRAARTEKAAFMQLREGKRTKGKRDRKGTQRKKKKRAGRQEKGREGN